MSKKKKTKRKNSIIGIIAFIAIITILIIALNSSKSPTKTNFNTAPPNQAIEGLKIGDPAPDFNLKDPEKGVINKESFKGKPLFIFFTTTWCTPCQVGALQLARFDDETGGRAFNVLVVFVDERESDQQIIEWRNKYGKSDWYIAKSLEMALAYNVKYLDTKFVIDKNGIIRWIDIYPLDYSKIKEVLGPLISGG